MAKTPGAKKDVFELGLDISGYLDALKTGRTEYAKLLVELGKPIPVALDDRVIKKLVDSSKKTSVSVIDAIKQAFGTFTSEFQAATELQIDQLDSIARSTAETAAETKKNYTDLYSFLGKLASANTQQVISGEERKAAAAEKAAARVEAANKKGQASSVRDDYAEAQRQAQFERFSGRDSRTGARGQLGQSLIQNTGRSVSGPESFRFFSNGQATNLIDPRVNAEIETEAQKILGNIRAETKSTTEQRRYAENIRKYLSEQSDLQAAAVREEQKFLAAMSKLPDRGAGLKSPVTGSGGFFGNRAQPQAQVVGPFDFVGGSQTLDKDRIAQANLELAKHRELLKSANTDAGALSKQHANIGVSAAQTVAQLAKLYVLYRAVRDVVREIESGISSFVQAGFQYQDQLDQGQVSLKGILGENFKILDSQGKQLRGAAQMNALTDVAKQQWIGIASTADSVKAKTTDLIDIYGAVAAQVTGLKGSTTDIQGITKGTAQLAQQLGIGFKEAGVQMAAVLDGKGGNRVSQALNLTKSDLFNLRDNPELITKVLSRLQAFVDATEGGQTIGDIASQFARLMGVVSSNVEAPFFDLLRDAVKELDRISKDPESQAFFALLRRAIGEAASDVRHFGQDLRDQSADGLGPFIQGVSSGAKVVIQLGEGLVFVTKSLAEFGGQNRSFIFWIASVAASVSALVAALNFGARLVALSQGTGLVATALNTVVGPLQSLIKGGTAAAAVTGELEVAATSAAPAISGVATGLVSLTSAISVGALFLGLGKMVQYLARIHDEALGAKDALTRLQSGDLQGALLSKQQELNSPDLLTKSNAFRFILGDALKSTEKGLGLSSQNAEAGGFDSAAAKVRALKAEVIALNQELSSLANTESEEAQAKRKAIAGKQDDIDATQRLIQGAADLRLQAPGALKVLKELATNVSQAEAKIAALSEKAARHPNAAQGAGESESSFAREVREAKVQLASSKAAYDALLQDWSHFIKATDKASLAARSTDLTQNLKARDKDPDMTIPGFFSASRQDLEELEIGFKKEETLLKSKLKNELISQEDYEAAVEALETKRVQAVKAAAAQELVDRLAFDKLHRIDPKTDPDTQRIQVQSDRAVSDAETKAQEAENDTQGRAIRLGRTLTEQSKRVDVEIARIFGGTEETVRATLEKIAKDVEDSIVKQGGIGAKDAAQAQAKRITDLIPQASAYKELQKQAQLLGKEFDNLRQEQGRLDQAFNQGRINADQYTQRTLQNRAQMVLALVEEAEKIQKALALSKSGSDDETRLTEQFRAVNVQLEEMRRNVVSIHDVMSSFTGLVSNIAGALSVTDGIGQRIDMIMKSFGRLGNITNLLQSLNKFKADFKLLNQQNNILPDGAQGPVNQAGGAAKSFFSLFSPNGAGTGPNGAATSVSAAIGAATVGVSIALDVGMALFKAAVDRVKKSIQSSIDIIAKSLETGAISLGQSISLMEKQRQDAIARNSDSKSGRKALEELLPQLDSQIDALIQKAKGIQTSFEDSLKRLTAGAGPFGDFARQLFDLEKQTKDYLESFSDQTSEAYAKAIANVQSLFDLTLEGAQDQYRQNLQSDLGEAVASAQKVNDLTDQQSDLLKTLNDQSDQRLDLEKQRAALQVDEQKRLQNIFDIQKQIADLLIQAAMSEADIRRKGVLEGQLSIAETKANEIANLRDQTADQLKSLQDQLAQAKDTSAAKDRVAALDKQARALQEARAKTEQALRLNEIELLGARRVAEIEAGYFGLARDRYSLAADAAGIEIANANTQVKKWRETKDLVDAIIKTGGHFQFDPPPGFPKVEVHIGSITIDNSDHSQNQVNVPGGSGGGGTPPPSGGGGPDPEPGPVLLSQPGRSLDYLRSGYSDFY